MGGGGGMSPLTNYAYTGSILFAPEEIVLKRKQVSKYTEHGCWSNKRRANLSVFNCLCLVVANNQKLSGGIEREH